MMSSQPPALSNPGSMPESRYCPFCRGPIAEGVLKCRHCGEYVAPPTHSNGAAGCLGLFFGPVGLWYKGQWAAGFAWIAVVLLVVLGTGGFGIVLAPFFWVGMAIHAYHTTPKR